MRSAVASIPSFEAQFAALTGLSPFNWQSRLFQRFAKGDVPSALDLPTGLGKTSVMAIWLIAQSHGAKLPRRLVYVVDRRAVVDQATAEAERLRNNAKSALGIETLAISTLRGRYVDNREWLADPATPAIVVGTVDMVGSRLLFSGYGVSPKMRPYHAGLLGADALVVLDEAHLVPPFAHLLRAIEQNGSFRPKAEADRALLPRFVLLPLSATQRDPGDDRCGRPSFGLDEGDWNTDSIVRRRLNAKKRLRLEPLVESGQDKQLAEIAWELATKGAEFSRVVVFCDRRDRRDDPGGPSAQGVADAITKCAKRAKIEIQLLVGARRVREREQVAGRLCELGFIGEKKPLEKPAFLVATSAGEVGVDLDADHMVCDLVAWERMVQRLGRVNRRGEGDAEIRVFWAEPKKRSTGQPTKAEQRAWTACRSKDLIEKLPQIDGVFDASPGALRTLAERAREDGVLKALTDAATTPEPLRPAVNRALADAWSMTSLEHHTGRPEVAPWLRGWVEEERPQTTIVWRTHLPLRDGVPDWPHTTSERREVEDFFEAAPPHESEKLETETFRVAGWLQARAQALLGRKRFASKKNAEDEVAEDETPIVGDTGAEAADDEGAVPATKQPGRDDTVALMLSSSGDYIGRYTPGSLERERKGTLSKEFQNALAGKILVVDARFGGLKHGMLDSSFAAAPETADAGSKWNEEAQFRVRPVASLDEGREPEWRFEDTFVLERDAEGTPQRWLCVEHLKDSAHKEDARSIARPQELVKHQDWTRRAMLRLAEAVGLSGPLADALTLAAALHDEGKRAERWQRAFRAPCELDQHGKRKIFAKTRGPIDQALLDGYRHEFGSLRWIEKNPDFLALPEEWRELVLHLVAAHHGFARPIIETRGCEDAPPSALKERARDVALRFARLQKRWGPWGLAWLEALLRAADAQASRDNDEGRGPPGTETA